MDCRLSRCRQTRQRGTTMALTINHSWLMSGTGTFISRPYREQETSRRVVGTSLSRGHHHDRHHVVSKDKTLSYLPALWTFTSPICELVWSTFEFPRAPSGATCRRSCRDWSPAWMESSERLAPARPGTPQHRSIGHEPRHTLSFL